MVGLSEEELAELPVSQNSMSGCCAICLGELNRQLRVLPCCHGFHESCIFQWLRVNVTCPNCRYALKEVRPYEPINLSLWRMPVSNANILPGSDYQQGPWANTRSQVANRLYFL